MTDKPEVPKEKVKHTSGRRKSRELALQLLYQLDHEPGAVDLAERLKLFWQQQEVSPAVKSFAEELVRGTLEHVEEIDRRISQAAINWRIERMALVDRNIMRFAAYEILYREDIPHKVSINEALEVAKKFSTPNSVGFINGILDKIARP